MEMSGEGQEFIEASWIRRIARVLHDFAKLVGELADLHSRPRSSMHTDCLGVTAVMRAR